MSSQPDPLADPTVGVPTQPPTEAAPPQTAPRYGVPESDAPQHDGPRYGVPESDAPQHDGPQHDVPRYDAPQHDAPQQDPRYDAPRYDSPHQDAPGYDAPPQYAGAPQYAPSYGQQPGTPYGSPYDAPPGYPVQQGAPRRPRDRGALVAACLAFLVVVLGAPALVLAWRSAVGPEIVPSGLVGGLLAVAGLSVLAAGVFPLVTSRGESAADAGPSSLLRPPVVLALVGAILLVGAAIAV
jgi:hypothetical protein